MPINSIILNFWRDIYDNLGYDVHFCGSFRRVGARISVLYAQPPCRCCPFFMCMCSAGDSAAAPVSAFSPRSQSGYHVWILFGLDTIPHPPQITNPVIILRSSLYCSGVPIYRLCISAYSLISPMTCSTIILTRVTSVLWSRSCLVSLPVSESDPELLYHDTRIGSRIALLDTLVSHIVDVYGTLVFWGVWISYHIRYGMPRSGGLSLYSVRSPTLPGTVLLMCIVVPSGVVVMLVL